MDSVNVIPNPDRFFIGGEWVTPSSDATFTVIDSGTEQVHAVVAEAKVADIRHAIAAARDAFDNGPWPRLSHRERAQYMMRLSDELAKLAEPHAISWTRESGVIYRGAQARMAGLSKIYNDYAAMAGTFAFQERHNAEGGGVALLVREPVGVCAAIVPWNGAPGLITSKVAPALLAGCTIIVKASPESPGSANILALAAERAGLPAGVINTVTADREASQELVTNPSVDKIAFTGSTAAGRKIASLAGERIARVTLELGGKSPALILDDYDIATAAKAIASKATYLTGQVCSSLTRIIVGRNRHDALVAALAAEFDAVTVGDPFDPATGMGPLATRIQRDRVESYIAKGKAEGATLASGGTRPAHLDRGYFVSPTVFGNVGNDFTIAREEIFGPVLSVIAADSEEQAIAIANDTIYGLNASVFTHDLDKAYAVARRLRSGAVGHNGFRSAQGVAFGGFKQSGIGREGGAEGLRAYLESKVIVMDNIPASAGNYAEYLP